MGEMSWVILSTLLIFLGGLGMGVVLGNYLARRAYAKPRIIRVNLASVKTWREPPDTCTPIGGQITGGDQ